MRIDTFACCQLFLDGIQLIIATGLCLQESVGTSLSQILPNKMPYSCCYFNTRVAFGNKEIIFLCIQSFLFGVRGDVSAISLCIP